MNIRDYIDIIEGKLSKHSTTLPDAMNIHQPSPVGKFLYHGTPLGNALFILKSNHLAPGANWRGEGERVSMTRNYAVAKEFGTYGDVEYTPAVLIFDWPKLSSDFKMVAYNDTHTDGSIRRDMPMSVDGTEEEEAVYGTIRPLSKYLVSVNIDQDILNSLPDEENWMTSVAEQYDTSPRVIKNMLKKFTQLPILNRLSV